MNRSIPSIAFLIIFFGAASAEDWPQFRGPQANGVTVSNEFPTQWNAEQNIRWSIDLSQPGNGSAIVSAGKVFICSVEDAKGTRRSVMCVDADSGKPLWTKTVTMDRSMPTHKTNPYAGSTPACDGKRVIAWHASAGLHAYDMDGKSLWSRDMGEFRHMWGYGSSPVIVGDRVILNSGPGKQVFVAAFYLETGKTLWKHDEPVDGDGERNVAGKYMGTWSTPVPAKIDGRLQAVVALQKRILGIDIATGKRMWVFPVVSDRGDLAYSSPIIDGDFCTFTAGFKGPATAFRISGTGDIAENELWRIESNPQSIGTGVLIDGYIYRVGAGPNLIECLEAKTGDIVWQQRRRAAYWGSIALAGELAYATDQKGNTIVFRPSPEKFIEVAECPLDDLCNATPALADGRIYLRTHKKLWCIE